MWLESILPFMSERQGRAETAADVGSRIIHVASAFLAGPNPLPADSRSLSCFLTLALDTHFPLLPHTLQGFLFKSLPSLLLMT